MLSNSILNRVALGQYLSRKAETIMCDKKYRKVCILLINETNEGMVMEV